MRGTGYILIPFMVEDGGQRFIRIPGEKEYIRYENGRWI